MHPVAYFQFWLVRYENESHWNDIYFKTAITTSMNRKTINCKLASWFSYFNCDWCLLSHLNVLWEFILVAVIKYTAIEKHCLGATACRNVPDSLVCEKYHRRNPPVMVCLQGALVCEKQYRGQPPVRMCLAMPWSVRNTTGGNPCSDVPGLN